MNTSSSSMPAFVCVLCKASLDTWAPACPACSAPRAVRTVAANQAGTVVDAPTSTSSRPRAQPMEDVEADERHTRTRTGLPTFDAALGLEPDGSAGLVHGGLYILDGGEGAGKSTLVLRLVDAARGLRPLYLGTEEVAREYRLRRERVKLAHGVPLLCTQDLEDGIAEAEALDARLLVVDSLHGLEGRPLDNARRLISWAQETRRTLLCTAQRVKDGTVMGTRAITHLFDAHLSIEQVTYVEGEPPPDDAALERRWLVFRKNRFGKKGTFHLRLDADGWKEEALPVPLPPPPTPAPSGAVVVSIQGRNGKRRGPKRPR